ncbi:MAG: hypothetical protein Fur0042_00040 [Cyanophyceae cyanobacterium]
MSYLIAVFTDRIQAEEGYTVLEKAGFELKRLAIVGKGYKTADEFGLLDPRQQAWNQIRFMWFWTIPFGFAAGVTFSVISGLETFSPWAGAVGNHIVGGLLGAIAGAMGGLFVGGGTGLVLGSGDDLPYRNRLGAGMYLLAVRDCDPAEMRRATDLLRPLNPDSMQGYTEPGRA